MDFWTSLGCYSIFETDRLILRPFAFSDSSDFWDISSRQENLRFIFPCQTNQSDSDFILVHYFMKNPLGTWAIEDKNTSKMIGAIRFDKIDLTNSSAEIGYFLNKDFWKQGLMTECLKALTFLAFQEFGLKELHVITHQENVASQKVALNSGYLFKRQFKGSDRYTRKMRDYRDYQINKGDYRYE